MKERILIKAQEIFTKDGYSRLNMDNLARNLGISKKTLYEHFDSKQSLFHEVLKSIYQKRSDKSKEISDKMIKDNKFDFTSHVSEMSKWIAEFSKIFTSQLESDIEKYAHDIIPMCQEQEGEVMKNWEKVFLLGKEKGYIKENINRNVFWLMLSTSIHRIMRPNVLINLPYSGEDVMKMIYEVLTIGVLTEKGREEYIEKNINNK